MFSVVVPAAKAHVRYTKILLKYLAKHPQFIEEIIFVRDPISAFSSLMFRLKVRLTCASINLKIPIRYVFSRTRLYAGLARNRGWLIARSEWVMFLDADDEYSDMRFLVLKRYIESTPSANLFIHSYATHREDFTTIVRDELLPRPIPNESIMRETELHSRSRPSLNLFMPAIDDHSYPVHHGHLTVKRNLAEKHMFPVTRRAEDTLFCRSVLFGAGGVFFIPMKLSKYHPEKSSWRNSSWISKAWNLVKHRVKIWLSYRN